MHRTSQMTSGAFGVCHLQIISLLKQTLQTQNLPTYKEENQHLCPEQDKTYYPSACIIQLKNTKCCNTIIFGNLQNY